jgi:hypothetical protein
MIELNSLCGVRYPSPWRTQEFKKFPFGKEEVEKIKNKRRKANLHDCIL